MIYCIPLDEATEEFYASVARAAGLPIEQVLRDTLFKLAGELALEALRLTEGLVDRSNANAASDLGCAALHLGCAIQGAWLNVLINLSSLKDKEYADECCHKGEAMLAHAIPLAEECYEKVLKVIEKK